MKRYVLILFVGITLVGCWSWEPKELVPASVAAFTVANDGCTAGCTITFTSTAQNATSLQWEVNGVSASTETSFSKQFTTAGSYTIKLTATNKGGSNSTQKTVTVAALTPPTAAFTISNNGCTAPCTVNFTNSSNNATSYSWDFGYNGLTSTQTSPSLSYSAAGSYTVKLTATGAGTNSTQQTVNVVAALFSSKPRYSDLPFATMVLLKGGTFLMGDFDNEGGSDEQPGIKVSISDFYMGQYEVTQRQWVAVMGSNPSGFTGCDDCPVENVSWDDVQAFLVKLNQQRTSGSPMFRLPTEAEWEYAAGGGTLIHTRFGNGKSIANPAEINYDGRDYTGRPSYSIVGEKRGKPIRVGSFSSNALGLYDMSGNVEEWCSDWYGSYTKDQVNPTGPSSGMSRVVRGGQFVASPQSCRVTSRSFSLPFIPTASTGFRVVSQSQ